MMEILEWAENEIKTACKKENQDYGCACYESAMKAFKSLLGDNHSGFSIFITKRILMRLIDGKPLTPIEEDDIWNFCYSHGDVKTYQCERMSSFFKDVHPDGTIKYHDIDRIFAIDIGKNTRYHDSFIDKLIAEIHPITLPYYPEDNSYEVYVENFLYDETSGLESYDTKAVHYYVEPNGKHHDINRYFKYTEDDDYLASKEIDVYEYLERRSHYEERTQKSNQ